MTTTCARDHDCTCVSLVQAGYNYKFAFGEGGHNMVHGGSIFPDTLRYIWSDCLTASGDEGAGYAGGYAFGWTPAKAGSTQAARM